MHRVMIGILTEQFPAHAGLFAGWSTPPTDPNDANDPVSPNAPSSTAGPFNPDMAHDAHGADGCASRSGTSQSSGRRQAEHLADIIRKLEAARSRSARLRQ
jgi:hypothetical protein